MMVGGYGGYDSRHHDQGIENWCPVFPKHIEEKVTKQLNKFFAWEKAHRNDHDFQLKLKKQIAKRAKEIVEGKQG